MSVLVIVQDKIRKIDSSENDSPVSAFIVSTVEFLLSSKRNAYEYFFDISYSDGPTQEVMYKKTTMKPDGTEERLVEGTSNERNDKLIAIAHELSSKGFKIDKSQLALFLDSRITRLICSKQ